MDNQAAEQLITETFDFPFDIGRYKLLSRNIFKEFDVEEFSWEGTTYIPEGFRSHIQKYERLGTYEDTQGKTIDILIVHINEGLGLDRARTLQRNFISNYLDGLGKDAALVAFTTSDMEDWRFSLITIEYKTIQDESGKVKTIKELSNAKRFSFLVGKNEANHTAQQQIIPLLTNNDKPSIEDLEQAFSVEKITDEFYQDYKKRFLELCYEINRVLDKDEKIKQEFLNQNINTDNFAKKLMGQIVFLYFVQKKGWLGVGKDIDGNFLKWGKGDKKFMMSLFEKKFCEYDNYFNDVLEPLFYEALATELENNYYSKFECKIPFLSGGLFEPMNGYNWQETDITISNNVIKMILGTFDRYNFTVKEDDPLDKEVAIDPEMLGKVFENLLPEHLKKGNGAYYTPRPIVHYMCQESLINYLDTHLDIDKKDITLLVKEGDAVVEYGRIAKTKDDAYEGKYQKRMPNSIIDNANEIDKLLTDVKICDPAIGSGAFPMGLLHEIVVARNVLTNYIDNEYSRSIYKLKSDCIQNSIYGVDIDEGAVEISKLRLWLSLIVDEDDIDNIKPLPNLDYKIICGNSLMKRYDLDSPIDDVFSEFNKKVKSKGYKNKAISDLVEKQDVDLKFYKKLTNDFLLEPSRDKKTLFRELIGEIKNAFKVELEDKDRKKLSDSKGALENLRRINIFGEQEGTKTEINKAKTRLEKLEKQQQETQDGVIYRDGIEWRFEFPNLLDVNGGFMGFDILIANPPYLSNKEVEKRIKDEFGYSDDLYNYFYLIGDSLLKDSGVFCYITSNTFLTLQSKLNIRQQILKNSLRLIANLGHDVFKSAMVSSAITIYVKVKNLENRFLYIDARGESKLKDSKSYIISQSEYFSFPNMPFFTPNKLNLSIKNNFGSKLNQLQKDYWDKISTSRNIKKFTNELNEYRDSLSIHDVTMLGAVTDGGQGLATGNNGRFVGVLEGTKEAQRIQATRIEKINAFNIDHNQDYNIVNMEEVEIRDLFDKLKNEYNRDVFGQGYLFRIVKESEITDLNKLTAIEKEKGISGSKCFVPYDKGDKDGNRWFLKTPYYIDWSEKAIADIKSRSHKSGKGKALWQNSQFYFREGFCWSDIHTIFIKSRLKGVSVHDVKSMSLFPFLDLISGKYIVCILNSKFASNYVHEFLNSTSSFQINDARQFPIIVPTNSQLVQFENIFNKCFDIQTQKFEETISKETANELLEEVQIDLDEEVNKLYKINF